MNSGTIEKIASFVFWTHFKFLLLLLRLFMIYFIQWRCIIMIITFTRQFLRFVRFEFKIFSTNICLFYVITISMYCKLFRFHLWSVNYINRYVHCSEPYGFIMLHMYTVSIPLSSFGCISLTLIHVPANLRQNDPEPRVLFFKKCNQRFL